MKAHILSVTFYKELLGMDVLSVNFSAFGTKHISLVGDTTSSSDIMTGAIARTSGRAAIRLHNAKNSDNHRLFSSDLIDDNKSAYRSGTLTNSLIVITSAGLEIWKEDILKKSKQSTVDELHVTTEIKSAALIKIGLNKITKTGSTQVDKQATYGNNLMLSGGYGVKVTVLVKIEDRIATVVHLDEPTESVTHSIPTDQLQKQEAIFTEKFLNGLSSL